MKIKNCYIFVLFYLIEYLYCTDSKIIFHNYKSATGNITENSLSIISDTVVTTLLECAKTCSLSRNCVGLFVERNGRNFKTCTLVHSHTTGDVSQNDSIKTMWIKQV